MYFVYTKVNSIDYKNVKGKFSRYLSFKHHDEIIIGQKAGEILFMGWFGVLFDGSNSFIGNLSRQSFACVGQ